MCCWLRCGVSAVPIEKLGTLFRLLRKPRHPPTERATPTGLDTPPVYQAASRHS